MATITFTTYGALTSVLTTELNSLASSARAISAAVTNTVGDRWADFELVVTYDIAPGVGGYVGLYIIPSLDDVNYADGDNTIVPANTLFAGSFPLRTVITAQRIIIRSVIMPAGKFKVLIDNQAGQAMAASNNTVKYRIYNEEVL